MEIFDQKGIHISIVKVSVSFWMYQYLYCIRKKLMVCILNCKVMHVNCSLRESGLQWVWGLRWGRLDWVEVDLIVRRGRLSVWASNFHIYTSKHCIKRYFETNSNKKTCTFIKYSDFLKNLAKYCSRSCQSKTYTLPHLITMKSQLLLNFKINM